GPTPGASGGREGHRAPPHGSASADQHPLRHRAHDDQQSAGERCWRCAGLDGDVEHPRLGRQELMLTQEENALLTRVGPGTPMGTLLRRYWMPACLSEELPAPDCDPIRVRLLGEDFVAFRDSEGRVGVMDEFCPHRRASLVLGRNELGGLRCLYHGWKMDVDGNVLD